MSGWVVCVVYVVQPTKVGTLRKVNTELQVRFMEDFSQGV
jgi:hypothetical protein